MKGIRRELADALEALGKPGKTKTAAELFGLLEQLPIHERLAFAALLNGRRAGSKVKELARLTEGEYCTESSAEADQLEASMLRMFASSKNAHDSNDRASDASAAHATAQKELIALLKIGMTTFSQAAKHLMPFKVKVEDDQRKRRLPKKPDTPALMKRIRTLHETEEWKEVFLIIRKETKRWKTTDSMVRAVKAYAKKHPPAHGG